MTRSEIIASCRKGAELADRAFLIQSTTEQSALGLRSPDSGVAAMNAGRVVGGPMDGKNYAGQGKEFWVATISTPTLLSDSPRDVEMAVTNICYRWDGKFWRLA